MQHIMQLLKLQTSFQDMILAYFGLIHSTQVNSVIYFKRNYRKFLAVSKWFTFKFMLKRLF